MSWTEIIVAMISEGWQMNGNIQARLITSANQWAFCKTEQLQEEAHFARLTTNKTIDFGLSNKLRIIVEKKRLIGHHKHHLITCSLKIAQVNKYHHLTKYSIEMQNTKVLQCLRSQISLQKKSNNKKKRK